MRALLPFPNATPYVFHCLEPVIERLATEPLPAVLDADLNKARQNILYTSAEINRSYAVPPLPPEEPLG
jgi:hypothetical protein